MASYTQGAGSTASLRSQDHGNADQKKAAADGGAEGRHISRFSSEARINIRSAPKTHAKGKRSGRGVNRSGPRISVVAFLILSIVSITIFGGDYLFSLIRNRTGRHPLFQPQDIFRNQGGANFLAFWNERDKAGSVKDRPSLWDSDNEAYTHIDERKTLRFGKAHVKNEELIDRDSRFWDRDDRIRDLDIDYEEADLNDNNKQQYEDESELKIDQEGLTNSKSRNDSIGVHGPDTRKTILWRHSPGEIGGLYNERGREELRIHEELLEAALKEELDSTAKNASRLHAEDVQKDGDNIVTSTDVHFDDGGNLLNANSNPSNSTITSLQEKISWEAGDDDYYSDVLPEFDHSELITDEDSHEDYGEKDLSDNDPANEGLNLSVSSEAISNTFIGNSTKKDTAGYHQGSWTLQPNKKPKHRRHSGLPCEIDFLKSTEGVKEPEENSHLQNFSLKYVDLEYSEDFGTWRPRFAGHQSLLQRNQSFLAQDQTVHCGFVQLADQAKTTGFDMELDDVKYLGTCRIAVSSCIFGSSDNVRTPRNSKVLTGSFKKDVCFVMFVDQLTLDVMLKEGQQLDKKGYVGPWKIILVKNMPYADARRVGKIPKFLTHRLFPAARYSIWLDSKLRLQTDPVLILEYFLWRGGFEYAISNHYDRHCVWEEVMQNKKLNKYNHTSIDEQFAFYRADGLTRFNSSDRRKLLPSNVPEGSFIIRAHTPMSNLFSCLWFNEVDRFTSRDQLSFAYTYMKFVKANPSKHFYLNMFKDCERKSIAKLFRHRKSNPINFLIRAQQEAD